MNDLFSPTLSISTLACLVALVGCDTTSRSPVAVIDRGEDVNLVDSIPDSLQLGMDPDSLWQEKVIPVRLVAGRTYVLQVMDATKERLNCFITVHDSLGNAWPREVLKERFEDDTGLVVTGCKVEIPIVTSGLFFVEVGVFSQKSAWVTMGSRQGVANRDLRPDAWEPNASIATAAPIQGDAFVEATLFTADQDNYRWIAPHNGVYELTQDTSAPFGSVYLYACRLDSTIQHYVNSFTGMSRFAAFEGDTVVIQAYPPWLLPGEVFGGRYRFQVRRVDDLPTSAILPDPAEVQERTIGPTLLRDDQAKVSRTLHGLEYSSDRDSFQLMVRSGREYTLWINGGFYNALIRPVFADTTVFKFTYERYQTDSLYTYTLRSSRDSIFSFAVSGRAAPYVLSVSSNPLPAD